MQLLTALAPAAPALQVLLLHDSARSPPGTGPRPGRQALVDLTVECGAGVVLTTYDQMRIYRCAAALLPAWAATRLGAAPASLPRRVAFS